jgi:hypothetical protein
VEDVSVDELIERGLRFNGEFVEKKLSNMIVRTLHDEDYLEWKADVIFSLERENPNSEFIKQAINKFVDSSKDTYDYLIALLKATKKQKDYKN